jgi:GTPase SAR1 family protein
MSQPGLEINDGKMVANGVANGITNGDHTTTFSRIISNHQDTQSPSPDDGLAKSFLDATEDEEILFNVIEELRELNIANPLPLPQIIVCGAQSSGKSSTLEALAKIPFPRDSGVCTKFKTKVTLVRDSKERSVELYIVPGRDRPSQDIEALERFRKRVTRDDWDRNCSVYMADANRSIFSGSKKDKKWANDTLSITIHDPNTHPLQLVDLPGLINFDHANDGNRELVQELVEEEMKQPNSIILAVVKATEDVNNHFVLELCRKHDPRGFRTIGVVTRPDEAIDNAEAYIKMIKGDNDELSKAFTGDWHVIVNRNKAELDRATPTSSRNQKERKFFTRVPWNQLSPDDCGIHSLETRLRGRLLRLAREVLPKLQELILDQEEKLKRKLDELGGDNLDDKELRQVFKKSLERLRDNARDHARGIWGNDVRKDAKDSSIFLRSRITDVTEVFRDRMTKYGLVSMVEGINLIDGHGDFESVYKESFTDSAPKTKEYNAAVDEIMEVLNSTRGQLLPGFFDPRLINLPIWQQSEEWNRFAKAHINRVYDCCKKYFKEMTVRAFAKTGFTPAPVQGFGNNKRVARLFYNKYLIPSLSKQMSTSLEELSKLEEDRLDYSQSFNREFNEKHREEWEKRNYARTMASDSFDEDDEIDPERVARMQSRHLPTDRTRETAEGYLTAALIHSYVRTNIFMA